MSLVVNAVKEYEQCSPDQAVSCRVVWKLTGNETAADVAEWVIGKPTAILVLIVIGLVARWIVHRLIDRMVKHAEEPVVGKVGGRFGLGSTTLGSDRKGVGSGTRVAVRVELG